MASSGNAAQQGFRKALGALKDSTKVGMANLNSGYKAIDIAIVKATNHEEALPKEKHVRIIFNAVCAGRARADVAYCIHGLARRLTKTHNWAVALKTLLVIHRAMRELDSTVCEELANYTSRGGRMLNISYFKDESSSLAWEYSSWIRSYALYLQECLECFRILNYDVQRERSRTKNLDTPDLLERLPALQRLLLRLLECQPLLRARYNFLISFALSLVASESVNIYVAITDGILNLVDKYFTMQQKDAVQAIEIYRKEIEQAEKLAHFFEMCRGMEFGRGETYAKITQPPASFLVSMEEYIKDSQQTLMLTWTPNEDESSTSPTKIIVEDNKDSAEDRENSDAEAKEETASATPLIIPDLMSLDYDESEVATEPCEADALSQALVAPEDISNDATTSESTGWELALVTDAKPASTSIYRPDGGVDKSLLDSLYDAASAISNMSGNYQTLEGSSSNPFEVVNYEQNNYYEPSSVAPPTFQEPYYSNVGYPTNFQEQYYAPSNEGYPTSGHDPTNFPDPYNAPSNVGYPTNGQDPTNLQEPHNTPSNAEYPTSGEDPNCTPSSIVTPTLVEGSDVQSPLNAQESGETPTNIEPTESHMQQEDQSLTGHDNAKQQVNPFDFSW
ncbi:vesicle coat protein [Lithospermum erythrorhizon]|uniref:Vesicle coat protein n=1 Tax=Lithospermum erythrorhizon TaxID=34254 RepID=A0AAV3NKQ7_LITER